MRAFGEDTVPSITTSSVFTAIAGGLISGLLGYVTCRSFNVHKSTAAGIGVTLGIMTTIGHWTNDWLRGKALEAIGKQG